MIHHKALTAFGYRKSLGFWFGLGLHCSRFDRSSSIVVSRSRPASVMSASLAGSWGSALRRHLAVRAGVWRVRAQPERSWSPQT
jgi:hypothetical protein